MNAGKRERSGKAAAPSKATQRHVRDELQGEALHGLEPVHAALIAKEREIHSLYVQEGTSQRRWDRTERLASNMGVPVRRATKHELNLAAGSSTHQGVVLDCSRKEFVGLEPGAVRAASEAPRGEVGVALDEVQDPRNFGAILRSSFVIGADWVLACARNSAPLSPAASKTSGGAMELMTVYSCKQMPKFLSHIAEKGYDVVGADPGAADAVPATALTSPEKPTLLVLGSEGEGLRTNTRRSCTRHAFIEFGGPAAFRGTVDSLNVSVAAGIFLHRLKCS